MQKQYIFNRRTLLGAAAATTTVGLLAACGGAAATTPAKGCFGFCATYAEFPVSVSTFGSAEHPLTAAAARPARIRVRRFNNMGFLPGA